MKPYIKWISEGREYKSIVKSNAQTGLNGEKGLPVYQSKQPRFLTHRHKKKPVIDRLSLGDLNSYSFLRFLEAFGVSSFRTATGSAGVLTFSEII